MPARSQPVAAVHWRRRIPVLGPIALMRPRWSLSVMLGVAAYFFGRSLPFPVRLIAAWDFACLFFLVTTTVMAFRESPKQVRARAQAQDQGATVVLLLTLLGVAICLAAILGGSKELKDFAGSNNVLPAVLVGATLILTWLTTHCSFALHYAHLYYGDSETDAKQPTGGLDFPGDTSPDYLDFAYFSLVLGMTFQVSDISITSRHLRRLATLHSVVSFFFSTVILALAINLLADLAH